MSWNIVQASSFYQLPALNAKFMSLYFSSFLQKHVSFNHFKRPRTILVTNENVKLKELLVLEFCRNPNKVISILTETHIYHDQIHHIRNNWLGSNFFSLGDSHTKGCLSCFIWDLKVDTDPKGRFVSFRFNPSNDRVLCVHAPQGIAPGNSWTADVSLKDYKIIWKIRTREMKTK